ncbi:diguanylate cyclase/phosphodiesterase [Hoeflea marina]|uniref:Diguanylate cyclase/phosphodiesterase n=1 Tax=Hoeflea marina TaxID=274592 RepID=A0A317PG93_9HYPH|nr:EAL domain-containing protein [Hoeflea marina]PWV99211.1 diguanylate cyclase/phosphodiesterase [Hoeflea marina]
MSIRRIFTAAWSAGHSTPDFHHAQYGALTRQIPMMYAILLVNMATLAYIHLGAAPDYLTIAVPTVLGLVCVYRAAGKYRGRHQMPAVETIRRNNRDTMIMAVVLGAAITAWSLTLFGYGDAYSKGQVTFFNGITIIAIITCLMPLRQIPPLMISVVVVPTCLFLLLQDETAFRAIAVNMILVIGALSVVLRRAHTDFSARVEKQLELDIQRQQLQSLNDRVSLLAAEDSLTGLPNRRSFFDGLARLIDGDGIKGSPFAVGIIDLDGFKPVNDMLGHGAGDKLLHAVGRRLATAMPYGASIFRLGGDEFAIILPCPGSDDDILEASGAILATLAPTFALDEGKIRISATCGVARFPDAGQTAADLFERADFALYHAKAHERGGTTIFSSNHETAIKQAATVSQRLRDADLDAVLSMEYQPIVDARTGTTLGLEALARWNDPVLGRVPPDVFIRTAEQAGVIGRVTLALFRKALRAASTWPDDIYLSFNLSAQDVCSGDTMAAIFEEIERTGFPITRLVFEVTESAIMQDFGRACTALNELRTAGAAIALDDFGTGYSSLSYVRKLPIDRIKIDRSFILDIEKEQAGRDILKTIFDLCRNLRLQCIVEGVETHSQLAILASIGGTTYQGYLFSRPMAVSRVAEFLSVRSEQLQAG